jgi:hypothetical protein
MTIDSLGRASALAARRKATQEVDPTMMLEKLHHTHRTRTVIMTVAGAAAAVVGIVLVVHGVSSPSASQAPVAPSTSWPSESPCSATVQCLGGNRYRVTDMPVPVTVRLPGNFQGVFKRLGAATLEDYRADVETTGVTVFENAVPVKNDASWTRDPAAGATAQSMATWLSRRPFLTHATMTQTTIGGRTAWLVTGDLKDGAPLLAVKDGNAAAPTFADSPATAAYSPTLTGEYTLVDVPGAGVTVIWSWAPAQIKGNLTESLAYANGLSFGRGARSDL